MAAIAILSYPKTVEIETSLAALVVQLTDILPGDIVLDAATSAGVTLKINPDASVHYDVVDATLKKYRYYLLLPNEVGALTIKLKSGATLSAVVTITTVVESSPRRTMRGARKGATVERDVTVSPIDANHDAMDVNVAGVSGVPSTSVPAEDDVPAANADTPLLAANAARKFFSILNDSDRTLYLSYGGVASAASPIRLEPDDYYEDPAHWVGAVNGFWDVGVTGNAHTLELE